MKNQDFINRRLTWINTDESAKPIALFLKNSFLLFSAFGGFPYQSTSVHLRSSTVRFISILI